MEKLVQDYKIIFNTSVESVQKDVLRALETGLKAKRETEAETARQEASLRNRIIKLNELKKLLQNL